MNVIRIHETGGPEVMKLESGTVTEPGPGEIRLRHTAIGLNYIDTYHRSGLYPVPLPSGLGLEAAGVVEAVGEGVEHLKTGERVAYGNGPLGAYAEVRVMPANRVTRIPETVADDTAAAMMLKGMTVRYLLKETYAVQPGDTVLIHAAAGGVGSIAGQWAKALGATVIGTAGSPEKCELARAHGYDHCIDYSREDVAARVRELTDGTGVPVVYDGVGRATLEASLDSLRPRGLLVSFGNASGPVTGFSLGTLASKGSLYVTRPTLGTHVATDEALQANARDVIDIVASGKVRIDVAQRFPLGEAAEAHRALEARRTTGSTVLVP
ncbi:MAG: quinone oxidoreductase [Gemmatimonadota bacterium]|nr:quinone oxidoreductase [Gemmatimonadota bacterium]